MGNSSVSLNNIVLNISKTAEGEISFKPGEVVRGTVKDVVQDNLVTIVLKGRLIEAITEVKVNPGQDLHLLVDSLKDGKTYLKVLSSEMLNKIENSNLAATLIDIGIPPKPENLDIARKLWQFQLPVNKENLLLMDKNLNILGGNNPHNLEIAGFALSKQISNADSVKSLLQFVSQGDISRSIGSLLKAIQQIEPAVTPANIANPSSAVPTPADPGTGSAPLPNNIPLGSGANTANTAPTADNTAAALISKNTVPDPASPILSGQSPESSYRPAVEPNQNQVIKNGLIPPEFSQSSVTGEKNLISDSAAPRSQTAFAFNTNAEILLPENAVNRFEPAAAEFSTAPEPGSLLPKVNGLLKSLLDVLDLDPEPGAQDLKLQIQQRIEQDADSTKVFNLLKELAHDEHVSNKFPVLKELPAQLERLEQEITGQRLINIYNRSTAGQNEQIYFSFPIKFENEYRLCQLKIKKDSSAHKIVNQDKLQIAVALNTEKLGTVLFHVNWQNKNQLQIQGVVTAQEACEFLNDHIDELLSNLRTAGFEIQNLGIKVSQNRQEFSELKPEFQDVPYAAKPIRVDIRV